MIGDTKRVLTHVLPGRRWGFLASDLPWSLSSPLPWEAWPSATQGCLKTGPMGPNSLTISEDEHDQLWVYHGVAYFHSHFLDSDSKDSTVAETEIPQKRSRLSIPSPPPGNGVGSFFLVDRVGRRVLLMYGMITMCITMLVGTLEGQLWMALDGVRKKLVP